MNFKVPKNDSKYHWTNHVIGKMGFYGLSPDRVKRVIRSPKRVEEGIAENTIAVMQPSTNLKKPSEVWVMYQQKNQNAKIKNQNFGRKIIISAWRYPGISPVGKAIPIPADILEELKNEGIIN
ncbi:MAG: hypothetical protein A3B91_01075 [Candidatus Yanofskybacteria bacterium RIFCSPHIGHO2_02_FULL_41_29]|uniref:Uncharacterized protein n=1 Tax=Candidatus Yanofskybacteria bacterium RIFCSPHIGHO2_01_FULL_41_53 TaxID=1802663 RepID=A0A1F8EJJ3_9BACT|nr:MAG: hypothetical protein A2650_01600 [Candidatus Yanofskybacteria bacterium RIFCSPHIGHO2_01_FULL_41_53]OGN11355.1 MAG: hypothetical protein A3B91_01075 [Candidatus Yanofskybacteria bacterium RIFCSPHIGHO2_02_FULL_41_29]OGN17725.1 MAG: hypothetical protein A3F48_00615 [Candidatus Yanofskybacteria bacterium RIFCSPHIGHO2_12_FULL_41_9]OGN22742.1 MAG: hypothetical protein A2916_02265 [Candidatus Yanofskybacteria bacterium RIFCSPLOWO2_01_FULL_41_67]OGN28922.1 MAG: hypothetical protein A3H54_02145 